MAVYNIDLEGDVLRVGFGLFPAQNDEIVREAVRRLAELDLAGGPLILINGPTSIPVAVALSHGLSHLYEVVAVYDPKMGLYVVAVSHSPDYRPGDLIEG